MSNDILNELDLPWTSENENLETISDRLFQPLFDVKKFEIRPEKEKDKGIDHHIEIKYNGKYTNFRFVIQLKATDSIEKNVDGSLSLQLNTSNINYLWNNPMPAFYVLYYKPENSFYYENIQEFVKNLYIKDNDWKNQSTHVLRFNKVLNEDTITEIYNLTIQKGKFQRELNEKAVARSLTANKGDKVIVDDEFNVSDDSEIRELIEGIGLMLVNEGKWKEIVAIHKQASGNVASTSLYNLVLGLANYYLGNLSESLSFFKASRRLIDELNDDLQDHLKFFDAAVKLSLGLISNDDYESVTDDLENAGNVGLYVKLNKAKKKYLESFDKATTDRYEQYVKDVESIISDPEANDSIKLMGRCDLALFQGYKNNSDYIRNVSFLNAIEADTGPIIQLRVDSAKRFIEENNKWCENIDDIKRTAFDTKNMLAYYNALMAEVRVNYEMDVITDNIRIVLAPGPDIEVPEEPDKEPIYENMIKKIDAAYDYYKSIGFIDNLVFALSIKYEILHYLEQPESASEIRTELSDIIEFNDLFELKSKFEELVNGGTTHEKYEVWLENIKSESESKKKEHEEMQNDFERIDAEEKRANHKIQPDYYQIMLFPIGHFQFPKSKKQTVYDILNVTTEAQRSFDSMFGKFIPIANIYYNQIDKEGYKDGNYANKGLDSYKHIYEIRKAFYENGFHRIEVFT